MKQCNGDTTSGRRCRNPAKEGGRFCGHHGGLDGKRGLAMGIGAFLGNLLIPGLGGVVGGALAGNLVDRAVVSEPEKKKAYCAFDFHHDKGQKNRFIGQSKMSKSPFEVYDHSLLEAAPEREWKLHALAAIDECDIVVVLIGVHTHRAPGVIAEVKMARQLGVPTVQLRRRGDRVSKPVDGGGRMVDWTWENLRRVLS